MGGLRILALAPFPPSRDGYHGGSRAIAHRLFALGARNEVGLLHLRAPDEDPIEDALSQATAFVEEIPREPRFRASRPRGRRRAVAAGLLRGWPSWALDVRSPALVRSAGQAVRSWRPDAVVFECSVMCQFAGALGDHRGIRLLNEYEPGDVAALDGDARMGLVPHLRRALEARAWARYQRRALRAVDVAVALTERDAAALRARAPGGWVERIPLGLDAGVALDAIGAPPPSVVLVANYMHPPNLDAAKRLISILPRLRKSHPDVRLRLVGPNLPSDIVRPPPAGVDVVGPVPDVRPYLSAAAVMAAPLRHGGGTRLKVLEALAAGKAVVASTRAVEGLEVVDGRELLVADGDEELVSAIRLLLDHPSRRAELGAAARRWALRHPSWEQVSRRYDDLLEEALRRRG
jgi:glycosyltransferase involved in cell wall biosynthesis